MTPHSSNYLERIRYAKLCSVRSLLPAGGFTVVRFYPAGLFYTGYTLLPRLPMSWRRLLSRLLGSACKIYVVKPTTLTDQANKSL